MSVFRVKLQQGEQGNLDYNPGCCPEASCSSGSDSRHCHGDVFSTSIQRQVYIMGPNKINRLLSDGDTFTDCNYWKRFAYPNLPHTEAFIEVVTDDGSVYSDIPEENTYPSVSSLTVTAGTTFTDTGNSVDILSDFSSFANFVQIDNQTAQDIRVRLNGLTTAVFDLGASETQVFNAGDLQITKIEFDNTASGAVDADVQVIMSVRSVCNS